MAPLSDSPRYVPVLWAPLSSRCASLLLTRDAAWAWSLLTQEDGHALGQVFAHFALAERVDPKAFFRNAMTLGMRGQELSYDSARPTRMGEMHGVTVQWLGEYAYNVTTLGHNDRHLDWGLILGTICAADNQTEYRQMHFCMHGVGHAFGYKNIFNPRPPTTVCLPEPKPAIKDTRHALEGHRLCTTAPHPHLARLCGIGVWHGFFEYNVPYFSLDYSIDPEGVPSKGRSSNRAQISHRSPMCSVPNALSHGAMHCTVCIHCTSTSYACAQCPMHSWSRGLRACTAGLLRSESPQHC